MQHVNEIDQLDTVKCLAERVIYRLHNDVSFFRKNDRSSLYLQIFCIDNKLDNMEHHRQEIEINYFDNSNIYIRYNDEAEQLDLDFACNFHMIAMDNSYLPVMCGQVDLFRDELAKIISHSYME